MSIFLYPYKAGSRSCRALADALGARIIKRENSTYREGRGKFIINWGASQMPYHASLNHPETVAIASNKLRTLQALTQDGGISVPFFTTHTDIAQDWLNDGARIVERHILSGHSGEGIRIVDAEGDLEDAPLYVMYIPKKHEYRVHVTDFYKDDQHEPLCIHVQQKKRRTDVPDDEVNWQVRNHANGFIYATEGVEPPQMVLDEAKKAIRALGLHFGAVDVIWNERQQTAYVLEVNCAPGLEGQTVEKYAEAFGEYFRT